MKCFSQIYKQQRINKLTHVNIKSMQYFTNLILLYYSLMMVKQSRLNKQDSEQEDEVLSVCGCRCLIILSFIIITTIFVCLQWVNGFNVEDLYHANLGSKGFKIWEKFKDSDQLVDMVKFVFGLFSFYCIFSSQKITHILILIFKYTGKMMNALEQYFVFKIVKVISIIGIFSVLFALPDIFPMYWCVVLTISYIILLFILQKRSIFFMQGSGLIGSFIILSTCILIEYSFGIKYLFVFWVILGFCSFISTNNLERQFYRTTIIEKRLRIQYAIKSQLLIIRIYKVIIFLVKWKNFSSLIQIVCFSAYFIHCLSSLTGVQILNYSGIILICFSILFIVCIDVIHFVFVNLFLTTIYFRIFVVILCICATSSTIYLHFQQNYIHQQTIREINNIRISTTSEAYFNIENKTQIENNIITVSAITMKILTEIYDTDPNEFIIQKVPQKVFVQGEHIEVSPTGKIITSSGKLYVYEATFKENEGSEFSGKTFPCYSTKNINSKCYLFDCVRFNIVIIVNGSISNNKNTQNIQNTGSGAGVTQIINKIKIKAEKYLSEYNNKDFMPKQDNNNANNKSFRAMIFEKIFHRFGYFVNLNPESIQSTIITCGQGCSIIRPNFKIVKKNGRVAVWKVSHQFLSTVYYFINPSMEPLFINETLPKNMQQYVNQKFERLSRERLQQAINNYTFQNSIKDIKLCVIDKYYGSEVSFLMNLLKVAGSNLIFYDKIIPKGGILHQFDLIIYISDQNAAPSEQIDFINSQNKKGAGIFLWADNDPFFKEVNTILSGLQCRLKLVGNYYGTKTLKASDKVNTKGSFDMDHPVSAGFVSLYQGITICYPDVLPSDFSVFAYNTNSILQPSIMFREPTLDRGGIWIDTGFTKLFPQLHGSGQQVRQYTINAISYIAKRKPIDLEIDQDQTL